MHLCESKILIPVISEHIVPSRSTMVANDSARPVNWLIDTALFHHSEHTLCQVKSACAQQLIGWLRVLGAKKLSFGIRPERVCVGAWSFAVRPIWLNDASIRLTMSMNIRPYS